jgi:hypothetical protein
MIVFFRTFPTSPKLDALLIHVPDVLRGEIGEGVVNVFQKLVEVEDVHRIEILHALGVEVPRPGCTDLRMVLLEPGTVPLRSNTREWMPSLSSGIKTEAWWPIQSTSVPSYDLDRIC